MSADKMQLTNMVRVVASKNQALDEAYPDVGMPPPWSYFVDQALLELGLTKDEVDYKSLVK